MQTTVPASSFATSEVRVPPRPVDIGQGSQLCIYSEFCGKGVAVEHDGSVYACDHYVYPEYQLGNVHAGQLSQLVFSRAQVQFGYAKNETLPQYCRQCPFLRDCWGECPKNRIIRTPDGEPGLNYLCRGLKAFFTHAIPNVERISTNLKKHPQHPPPLRSAPASAA
jgi:uncharacterized protein